MQARFTIRQNDLTPALRDLAARVQNPRSALEAAGRVLETRTRDAFFNASARPSVWPALKPETLRRKGGRGGMLRESTALWESIKVREISNTSVVVATDRPYAAVHQFGAQFSVIAHARGRKAGPPVWTKLARPTSMTIPARPFFPFDSSGNLTPEAHRRVFAALETELRLALNVRRT